MCAAALANGAQIALARIPLFAGIAPGAVERLERFMARFEIASGERLFRQGDHGGRMHVIEHGRLELQAELTAGQTRVLAELGPGQLLGETSLLGGSRRTATAVAREPTSGWVLDRAGFEMLRLDVSAGAVEFMARMAGLAVARLRARYQRIAAELGGDGGALARHVRTRGCCPGRPGAGGAGVSAGTAVLPGVPRPRADRGGDRRRAPGRGPARSSRGRGGRGPGRSARRGARRSGRVGAPRRNGAPRAASRPGALRRTGRRPRQRTQHRGSPHPRAGSAHPPPWRACTGNAARAQRGRAAVLSGARRGRGTRAAASRATGGTDALRCQRTVSVLVRLWVPNTVSLHATWEYSWIRPPSRSCRKTRVLVPAAGGSRRPAGGFWCRARCGRWPL